MGDVINLRQARKAKQRADHERSAEANRAKHGRTKAERVSAENLRKRNDAIVDGAFREKTDDQ